MQVLDANPNREALYALNAKTRNIYGGTVSSNAVAKTRAKNKLARKSRKVNRSR